MTLSLNNVIDEVSMIALSENSCLLSQKETQ